MSDKSESFENYLEGCKQFGIFNPKLEDVWNYQQKKIDELEREGFSMAHGMNDLMIEKNITEEKLQAAEERERILREAVGDLIHHFNDYGMETESLVCLMAVEKARQALEKIASNEAGKEQE